MKLHHIIDHIKDDSLDILLRAKHLGTNYKKIYLYAEFSISTDAKYILINNSADNHIKIDNISFEKLCSLEEFKNLAIGFSEQYPKKKNDILVIDIVDHIYHIYN